MYRESCCVLELEPHPVLLRTHAVQAGKELAEGGCVGKMKAVGYLGDAQLRGAQQERGFRNEHLVDVVDHGAPRDLADNTREVDGADM